MERCHSVIAHRKRLDSYLLFCATSIHRETEDHLECRDLGSAVLVIQVQTVAIVAQRVEVGLLNHNVHVV